MTVQDLVKLLAEDLCQEVADDVVESLAEQEDVQTLDGIEIGNPWDFLCRHCLVGQEPYWTAIRVLVNAEVSEHVAALKYHKRLALWTLTNEGDSWLEG